MQILPINTNYNNFKGHVTVNYSKKLLENINFINPCNINKSTLSAKLNPDKSSYIKQYIINHIANLYGWGDSSMDECVYENLLDNIENYKELIDISMILPHAYVLGPESKSSMVQYSLNRNNGGLILKIGKKLIIEV